MGTSSPAILQRLKGRSPGNGARVGLKLLVIVIAVSLAGVIGSSALVLALQRQQLIEGAKTASSRLGVAMVTSIEHAMLDNDHSMIQQTLQAVAETGDWTEAIRILNVSGEVRVSSDRMEIGQRVDPDSDLCRLCHKDGPRQGAATARVISPGGEELLLSVSPIRNRPACYPCHDPQTPVLGLLMIERPLSELQRHTQAAIPRLGLSALLTFVFLAGLMLLALRKLVIRPISALADGLSEVGAGNLDVRVQVDSRDELGDLAAAFDTMRQQLKASRVETERRNQALSILNELALTASQTLNLQEVLDLALDTVVDRLGMHAGLIYLYDPETQSYPMRASRGATPEQCAAITLRRQQLLDRDIVQEVTTAAKVLFVPRMADDPRHEGIWSHQDRRSYVNVPLKSRGAVIGSMGLISRVDQVLSEREAEVLEAVGHATGIAIDNAQLYERVRHVAALEERDRLAREMHDNLAQSLGYLHLKAAMTECLLDSERLDDGRKSLAEIKALAMTTYRDVREAIFNLRTAALGGVEFLTRLQQYLEEYRAHYGVQAELLVQSGGLAGLPEQMGVQITRIVQEALTNVRRHAGTDRARVRVTHEQGQLEISIEDDGRGFDPAQVLAEGRQSFGLQVMRERATDIGGEVTVESKPGAGTRVRVRVPFNPAS